MNRRQDAAATAWEINEMIITEHREDPEKPSGGQRYLYDLFGKVAMVVPHDHGSQDLLVALLQELQRLPRHTVPHKVGDQVVPKELWVLTPDNKYDGLEQWLWEIDYGFTGSQRQVKHVENVKETASFTLVRPSVFATRDPETCPPEDYQPWVSAAAQWIIYAGDALYELYKKEITTEIGRQKWSLSLWDEWKARFEVATSEKFDYKTRTFAWAALGEMGEAESSGVTTNVAASFGLTSTEE
ncbi:hypothetical protein MGU_04318 [Metarhizium guizhouense ARSEF 977]|uniref:Uncharacterized protein n=1 Tax=Metarhizium guizhouense (strain ARSEF 977) TaxID=1276136 RepID=A0A0B4GP13_METGA|nr:hypothetical protein MGU_04318 [Metarhizium guizhouense ARSEF 977]